MGTAPSFGLYNPGSTSDNSTTQVRRWPLLPPSSPHLGKYRYKYTNIYRYKTLSQAKRHKTLLLVSSLTTNKRNKLIIRYQSLMVLNNISILPLLCQKERFLGTCPPSCSNYGIALLLKISHHFTDWHVFSGQIGMSDT